jgi:hypothetical protein
VLTGAPQRMHRRWWSGGGTLPFGRCSPLGSGAGAASSHPTPLRAMLPFGRWSLGSVALAASLPAP